MVSDEALGFGEAFKNLFGLNAEGTMLLMGIIFGLGFTLFIFYSLKNRNITLPKELLVFIFFGIMILMAMADIINWVIIIIPLFLAGIFLISKHLKEGGG